MAKSKLVFRSLLNHKDLPKHHTVNLNPSMTEPDQALTIPEMLKRYASGRPINAKIYDDYDGGGDHLTGVDIRTLDMSEVNDLIKSTQENIIKLRQVESEKRLAQKNEALEKSIEAKIRARLAQDETKPKGPIQLEIPGA